MSVTPEVALVAHFDGMRQVLKRAEAVETQLTEAQQEIARLKAELKGTTARMWQLGKEADALAEEVTRLSALPEWVCEQHPWLEWPHGECPGPGCPITAQSHLAWVRWRDVVQERDIAQLQASEAALGMIAAQREINHLSALLAQRDTAQGWQPQHTSHQTVLCRSPSCYDKIHPCVRKQQSMTRS